MNDRLMVTRDGVTVQYIEAANLDPSEAFAETIKQSKKKIGTDMLPEQVAELTLAEIQATQTAGAVKVLENTAATLDGEPAFRLHVQFKTEKGLRIEELIYGLMAGKRVLHLTYQAPTLHFFARDLNTFEDTIKSVRLSKAAAK
ncbi:MAG: hypothetical protein U1F34_05285 [Gammaproteobacteria bacterium]